MSLMKNGLARWLSRDGQWEECTGEEWDREMESTREIFRVPTAVDGEGIKHRLVLVRRRKTESRPKTQVKVKLVGIDGNAFAVMGLVLRTMRQAGVSEDVRSAYQKEAMSGDYDNLLRVTMDYVEVL